MSQSHNKSTVCHFTLNLKLIVFLQPEILDNTDKMILAAFRFTVLSDLTPVMQIKNDTCCPTQPFRTSELREV